MRAGKLRRRVSLQKPEPTRGANGEISPGWTEIARPWMAFEDSSARSLDQNEADQRVAVQHRLATMRYRTDVAPKYRIVDGANVYEIMDIADDDRKDTIVVKLKVLEAKARV